MDSMMVLTIALALFQILMGIIMALSGRVLTSHKESISQMRDALQSVVNDHTGATRELRGALEAINTRLLADTLPRSEFDRYRAEIRRDLNEIYTQVNKMAAAMARLEALVSACPARQSLRQHGEPGQQQVHQ